MILLKFDSMVHYVDNGNANNKIYIIKTISYVDVFKS